MWSFFGNKIYVLRKIMVISITQKFKQCNSWTNTWQHWNGHFLNDRVIKNCKKSTGLKIGKITRCYDIFMPKYDFEHYGSTENPWSLSIGYIFIFGLISTIIPPVLFSSLFFSLMNSQSFLLYTPLHSYFTLSVRQFALLIYLYSFSQCCYNLFPGTVFLCFPILWLQSLSTTSHSCLLLCTSPCYRYFIRCWYPSYIHKHQCYIWQNVFFCILLPSLHK